ncbi:hypothetical protein L2E82_35792 [Cichorium intybus]|uniref:Uncharacterized protein n=1 Tax=Cichorium intybus TaxID=13427 RepID=A0ACB9BQ18_CICIN|nr:hypothetical protein L2E82_35792 [Cichorium intybus]
MVQGNLKSPVTLIVGVTGMAGVSVTDALKNLRALGGPWTIYGVSGRPLPTWFPPSLLDKHHSLNNLNQEDTKKLLSSLSSQITHVCWVTISVGESEEVNIFLNSTMISNVLNALTSTQDSKLRHVTLQTGTKQYIGLFLTHPFQLNLSPMKHPSKRTTLDYHFQNSTMLWKTLYRPT